MASAVVMALQFGPQVGKAKKDGWDKTVAIRESSAVAFDFAADTVQEP
jgi:hypothetical protein